MRAGDLDRRVTIQVNTPTQDATGEPVESWTDVRTVWMGKRDMKATERWGGDQYLAEIETIFKAYYSPGFDVIRPDTHRLSYDGRIYNIHGVREIGRRIAIEIMASARTE